MPERPFVPPTRKAVSEYPTPDPSVAFYTELVNRDDPVYIANAPVSRGALYATMVGADRKVISIYPNLFFLRERKFQLDDQRVLWDWATDENAHDTYNAEATYVANAVAYPAFTRTYTVRRELYEADPTSVIGSPLPGIIAVEITSPGQNHTEARGVIDGTSVAIDFTVDSNGSLINGVITNTGNELIPNGTPITIIGDGQDSSAIAVTQPVGCVLTSQKKEELPDDSPLSHELVKVTRVYETLPGPWITSTRVDKDGMLVTSKVRRQVADFITDEDKILNGEWTQTWHKGTDNFVAEETVETRPLPGNPIYSTEVDVDGMVKTITKTLVDCSTIVSGETLIAGVWTKIRKEEIASTTFVKDTSASNKVCWQVSEARPIPGNPIPDTEIDKDGVEIDVARTMKAAAAIVTQETLFGGIWTRTESDPITDLVSWEKVTARAVPGNVIPSANVDQDHEVATVSTILKGESTITPSASEAGGIITTVEQREVTDLVSDQVTTAKQWLDAASYQISIENLIPREFMAFIPTFVESHVLSGTASMPTLALGQFVISEKQLTKLLYERRVTSLGPISLPITHTNYETTEEYGGEVLEINLTLDVIGAQAIDQGYRVVSSELTDLGNGMVVKRTASIPSNIDWPILIGTEVDPRTGIVIGITKQVVAAGAVGGVTPDGYFDVKPLDKWRSLTIASKLDPATLPLPQQWETTDQYSFPNTLVSATWIWASAASGCCYDFDMALETEITEGYAGPCRALVTESFTDGPPLDVVTITQFFPQGYMVGFAWAFAAGGDCTTCRASARTWGIPPTIHDEITIGGAVILVGGTFTNTLPATVPTAIPPSGTLITRNVDVERWRFGIFYRRITQIYVP